ncbi:histidinol-phosphate transaminase [uncultured Ilyobacter sp.]|uniref:histidinol-phosphate transaminase n=1 Tax=uncultured Ilyobacter sp. TaxID=544433 RepID=UPI0029F4A4C9|nr:histidinol-phosphate transaminase [uncultured Ilyobacter sp.]
MDRIILREEIENIRGYIPGRSIEEVKEEYGLTEIVKLASNENPMPPSTKVLEAIQKAAMDINIYPDALGDALRKRISEKYGVEADNIVVGNGGMEVILAMAGTIISKGDEIIMPATTFPGFGLKSSLLGGKLVKVPLKKYDFDLDKMLESITEKTKVIYICNPNNPTGKIIPKDKLKEFIDMVPKNIVVFIDEAYYYYGKKSSAYLDSVELLQNRENIIVLRSFSKSSGLAGLRVGFGLTNKKLAENFRKALGPFTVNKLAQAAAITALDDEEYLEKTVELNYTSLGIMEDFFKKNNLEYIESNANFIFVNVKQHSKIVFHELMKRGVIVRPGFQWGWDNWIRVSTGTEKQTHTFIEKLKEIL